MSVRIIAGTLSGRVIKSPQHNATRPTTDAMRTALFSAMDHIATLKGARVLDLYAGTGAFGFECLSRGAEHAVFVDAHPVVCAALQQTAQEFGVASQITIECIDVLAYLKNTTEHFPLIFADAPYTLKACNRIALHVAQHGVLDEGGIVIFEHGETEALLSTPPLRNVWMKERSQTVIEIYTKDPA